MDVGTKDALYTELPHLKGKFLLCHVAIIKVYLLLLETNVNTWKLKYAKKIS